MWLFHSRKLQINLTYSTSGMFLEKNFNRIRTVSISIKVDIFCTLNFNHFCSEAVTAHIPDPTKSWRTVSDGCPTHTFSCSVLSPSPLPQPQLFILPNLLLCQLLSCVALAASVAPHPGHKTDHDDRGQASVSCHLRGFTGRRKQKMLAARAQMRMIFCYGVRLLIGRISVDEIQNSYRPRFKKNR